MQATWRELTIHMAMFTAVATGVFSHHPAKAQTIPYNWGFAILDNKFGCNDNGFCLTPKGVCDNIIYYYNDTQFEALYPSQDPEKPVWWCDYIAYQTQFRHQSVIAECPIGYEPNMAALHGCAVKQKPKTLGGGCQSGPQAGNPITICSGNKYQRITDFSSAGINVLAFERHYNSESQLPSAMGMNWQHNWERRLAVNSATKITAIRADGQQLVYTKSGSIWSNADKDITLKLTASGAGYILTDNDDTTETYDATGALQTVAYLNGYLQTLAYTGGKLASVSDNQGRTLGFTYNTDGSLATMTDPDGKVYQYGYQLAFPYNSVTTPLLNHVTYPTLAGTNPNIAYLYEDTDFPTYLTGITDELGHRYATWDYDSSGQTVMSEHAGGAEHTTITYNADGTKTVTGPLGEQTKYTFTTIQNGPKVTREDRIASTGIPAANRIYTYDTYGFLASMTDWNGNKTTFVNNARGLQTSRTEAVNTPQARTITTSWHPTFRLPTQIVEPRKTTDFTYDSNGNLLTRTETDTTTQTIPYSTNGQTHTWTYTYDSLGHVLTETGPRTDVTATTTYTYDSYGNVQTITNPLSQVTTVNATNNRGLPTQITDANGVVSNLTYDALGRLLTRTVVASGGNATTTFVYNAAGLLTKITLPDSSALTYGYDDAHRLKSIYNNLGENINYTLDAAGNITQARIYNYLGTLFKTQNWVYDNLSRLTKDIGASAPLTSTYAYDAQGNRISATTPLSDTTTQAFDALNRLISATDPLTRTTAYGYNAADDTTSVTDPRSLVTSYIYNGFGEVIQETSPDRGATVYTLDKAGNRVSETDARSVVTNRTFDKLNRVLTETYPAAPSENVSYAYDSTASGNKGIGRLTGYTDESGSTQFIYDARGNMLTQTRVIGARTYTTSYTYNIADHVTQIIYPSGHVIGYGRDSEGRINAVTYRPSVGGPLSALASSVTYLPFGPVKSVTFGNGVVSTRSYDQNYRLTGIVTTPNVQNLTIGYDNASRITSITDALDSTRNQTFTYDAQARLLTASGKYGNLAYTYDANGNRLSQTVGGVTTSYTYPSTSNKLSSIGSRSFTYTADGDTATDNRGTGYTYSYNNRGRYSQVTSAGVSNSYKYAASGERVRKTNPVDDLQYHYNQDNQLINISSANTGFVYREYVWLDNLPLAQIEQPSAAIYYTHADQVDVPQKFTDSTGAVTSDRQQQPFGLTSAASGSTPPPGGLRFPGQFADSESALFYNMMRDYDPSTGRYIEADPIGWEGTSPANQDLYGYAGLNPLSNVDPSGNNPAIVFAGEAIEAAYGAYRGWRAAEALKGASDVFNNDAPKDDAKRKGRTNGQCTANQPTGDNNDERCRKVKDQCIKQCSDSAIPTFNHGFRFFNCVNQCVKDAGC